jgi:hypothetical protein
MLGDFMVKNLPLLMGILVIGCSLTLITKVARIPDILDTFLLITGAILSIWSMMGLILHLGIKHLGNS